MGSPVIIDVSHCVESLLNSHDTQHFSASQLASYEALLLSAPNITLTRRKALTQKLCYLVYRIKTPTTVYLLVTPFLFLGIVYRKLLLIMLLSCFPSTIALCCEC